MQGDPVAEDLYVVESITGKKVVEGKIYYRVKWEGYPDADSTWEKLSHLRYVASLVKDYEKTLSLSTDHPDSSTDNPPNIQTTPNVPSHPSDQSVLPPTSQPSIEPPTSDAVESIEVCQDELQVQGKTIEPDVDVEHVLIRSALREKEKKRKRKGEGRREESEMRLQKKEAKRLKQMRKEELRSPTVGQEGGERLVVAKAEEGEEVRIRLIVAEDDSDIRDYVVEYPTTGNTRVLNTCQMFYAHPVEFVSYLEKRTAFRNK